MMTPRERMIATLEHRMPDQVPIQFTLRDELMEEVMAHYKVATALEVEQLLGADLMRGVGLKTRWPDYERRINGELNGPFGNIGPTVLLDERTFESRWGVVEQIGSDGKYLQWVRGPFSDTDDLDSFNWPKEDQIVEDPALPAKVQALKEQGYWVTGVPGLHPFKQAWHMRGFENFLCDYITNPEWVESLYERFLGYILPRVRRSAAAGVDMLDYWGDVAMQDRMIVPPDQWRRLDKPAWRRIIAETRKVNPGVRFFFHSDGDTTPIIPDLIDIGFDIINPLQPECINPAVVKAKWGDQITLDGGGSVQRTLPRGTLDDVRREVDFLMRYCAWEGGYILRPSNCVGFDCPVENVVTYLEMARDYDVSGLARPTGPIPEPPCMSVGTH